MGADRAGSPTRVAILVSKFDHCLNDLLYRYRIGALPMEVTAIVSNHPDAQPLADAAGIPCHIPVTRDTKPEAEARAAGAVRRARQSNWWCLPATCRCCRTNCASKLGGRAINIHHSFLPGFKGAKPYHQAFERGVKLIGATAHFVTPDLDEGPIITQGVQTVDHSHYPEDLVARGQDIESQTLSRAIRYHIEKRVFLHGNRTVVFADLKKVGAVSFRARAVPLPARRHYPMHAPSYNRCLIALAGAERSSLGNALAYALGQKQPLDVPTERSFERLLYSGIRHIECVLLGPHSLQTYTASGVFTSAL